MEFTTLTAELFGIIFGAVVSVLFAWTPYLRTWYAKQTEDNKKFVMLGLAALTAIVIGISSCYDLWVFTTCDKAGALHIVGVFASFLISNQTAHKVVPKPAEYGQIKDMQETEG